MRALLVDVTTLAAVGIGAAALAAGALVLVTTRRPVIALAVLLDLLLAAGLLRLAGDPGWPVIATSAAVLALRQLLGGGLRAWPREGPRGGSRAGTGRRAVTLRSLTVGRMVRPAWRL